MACTDVREELKNKIYIDLNAKVTESESIKKLVADAVDLIPKRINKKRKFYIIKDRTEGIKTPIEDVETWHEACIQEIQVTKPQSKILENIKDYLLLKVAANSKFQTDEEPHEEEDFVFFVETEHENENEEPRDDETLNQEEHENDNQDNMTALEEPYFDENHFTNLNVNRDDLLEVTYDSPCLLKIMIEVHNLLVLSYYDKNIYSKAMLSVYLALLWTLFSIIFGVKPLVELKKKKRSSIEPFKIEALEKIVLKNLLKRYLDKLLTRNVITSEAKNYVDCLDQILFRVTSKNGFLDRRYKRVNCLYKLYLTSFKSNVSIDDPNFNSPRRLSQDSKKKPIKEENISTKNAETYHEKQNELIDMKLNELSDEQLQEKVRKMKKDTVLGSSLSTTEFRELFEEVFLKPLIPISSTTSSDSLPSSSRSSNLSTTNLEKEKVEKKMSLTYNIFIGRYIGEMMNCNDIIVNRRNWLNHLNILITFGAYLVLLDYEYHNINNNICGIQNTIRKMREKEEKEKNDKRETLAEPITLPFGKMNIKNEHKD